MKPNRSAIRGNYLIGKRGRPTRKANTAGGGHTGRKGRESHYLKGSTRLGLLAFNDSSLEARNLG